MTQMEHVPPEVARSAGIPMRDWNGMPVIHISGYDAVRSAFFDRDLSRSFDKRPFAAGNPSDGTVSTAHGDLQRARRRVENTQFRTERLIEYERILYPTLLSELLDRFLIQPQMDLAPVAPFLSVVLAAKRAGLDVDPAEIDDLATLIRLVDAFSQGLGPGLLEMPDPEAARARVLAAIAEFDTLFVTPARERREALLRGSETDRKRLPSDILSVLLQHREEPDLALDDSRIIREVATYLQGGTHSGAQTLLNTLYFVFPLIDRDAAVRDRIIEDSLFAARCVHETLRLRVVTPRVKRLAEADTEVAGVTVPKGSMVILNVEAANRSPRHYGPDADTFNPDRILDDDVPRWGLSFGLGAHGCPGRSSAVGLPVPADFRPRADHLFGLVTVMVQQVLGRGISADPERDPVGDTRSYRYNFWQEFPILVPSARAYGLSR